MDELEYYQNGGQEMPAGKKPGSRRRVKIIIIAAAVIGLILLFPPLELHTTSVRQYPNFKAYAERYHNIHEPEWYPDLMGDVQSDFRFDYMPSIMQGAGHWSVRFVTSPETAARYADELGAGAPYELMLSQYDDSVMVSVNDLGYSAPEYHNILSFYRDEDFWKGHEETARVYVLSSNLDQNHPHTSAVIVDEEAGMVEMSELG